MDKYKRIAISFSGGRTSAVMTKMLLEKYSKTHEIEVMFANTGCEHLKTLEFINNCDNEFNFQTKWIEADINPTIGIGPRAKIVNYETASRNGEPFEAAVAKHGVFSTTHPQCTSRLKTEVMRAHIRDNIGWKIGTYVSAIGIRFDEQHRCSKNSIAQHICYPLVEYKFTKQNVLDECRGWKFDLEIPEHYGNCVWCWKKSFRKLLTIAKESPDALDFPKYLEEKYKWLKTSTDKPRTFFRLNKSAEDILSMSKEPFEPFVDNYNYNNPILDHQSPCGDSCEIGTDSADREAKLIQQLEFEEISALFESQNIK